MRSVSDILDRTIGDAKAELFDDLLEWRREILTEAAERAVKLMMPLFPWRDEGSFTDCLRRAVMGEEVEP